jgi:hypothetical protein
VIHLQGGSTGLTPQRILMLYRAKLRYFAKHYGSTAERKLLRAMRLVTYIKIIVYTLLRGLGRGQAHKVDFWRTVSKGLTES